MKIFLPRWLALLSFTLLVSGCVGAAVMLAPLGLQATEAIGIGAAQSISGKHHDYDDLERDTAAGCGQLSGALPYVAEVKMDDQGAVQLRQWVLAGTASQVKWLPLSGAEGGGWHTEPNIAALDFAPPLAAVIAAEQARFLISAPIDAASQAEAQQQISFISVFGPRTGTYKWKNKAYQYAVMRKLPCFPLETSS